MTEECHPFPDFGISKIRVQIQIQSKDESNFNCPKKNTDEQIYEKTWKFQNWKKGSIIININKFTIKHK